MSKKKEKQNVITFFPASAFVTEISGISPDVVYGIFIPPKVPADIKEDDKVFMIRFKCFHSPFLSTKQIFDWYENSIKSTESQNIYVRVPASEDNTLIEKYSIFGVKIVSLELDTFDCDNDEMRTMTAYCKYDHTKFEIVNINEDK